MDDADVLLVEDNRHDLEMIVETLRALAALRQTGPAELAAQTTANFDRLFPGA